MQSTLLFVTTLLYVAIAAVAAEADFQNVHVNTHHVHSGPRSRIHSILTNGSSIPVRFTSITQPHAHNTTHPLTHSLTPLTFFLVLAFFSFHVHFYRQEEPFGQQQYIGRPSKSEHHRRIFLFVLIPDRVILIFPLKIARDVRREHRTISTILRQVRRQEEDSSRFPIPIKRVISRIQRHRVRSVVKRTPTKSVLQVSVLWMSSSEPSPNRRPTLTSSRRSVV